MSNDIKMSDTWDSLDFGIGYFNKVETEDFIECTSSENSFLCGFVFYGEEPAKAMLHATQSHDKLLNERKELEKSLKAMLNLLDYYRDDIELDAPSIDEVSKAYDLVIESK